MAWWGRRNERSEQAGSAGVPDPGATPEPVPPQPLAVGDPGWRSLPRLQRSLDPSLGPVAPLDTFVAGLAAHRDPRFLAPLGHLVSPSDSGGVVTGLLSVPTSQAGAPRPYSAEGELAVPSHPAPAPVGLQRLVASWTSSSSGERGGPDTAGRGLERETEPVELAPPDVTADVAQPVTSDVASGAGRPVSLDKVSDPGPPAPLAVAAAPVQRQQAPAPHPVVQPETASGGSPSNQLPAGSSQPAVDPSSLVSLDSGADQSSGADLGSGADQSSEVYQSSEVDTGNPAATLAGGGASSEPPPTNPAPPSGSEPEAPTLGVQRSLLASSVPQSAAGEGAAAAAAPAASGVPQPASPSLVTPASAPPTGAAGVATVRRSTSAAATPSPSSGPSAQADATLTVARTAPLSASGPEAHQPAVTHQQAGTPEPMSFPEPTSTVAAADTPSRAAVASPSSSSPQAAAAAADPPAAADQPEVAPLSGFAQAISALAPVQRLEGAEAAEPASPAILDSRVAGGEDDPSTTSWSGSTSLALPPVLADSRETAAPGLGRVEAWPTSHHEVAPLTGASPAPIQRTVTTDFASSGPEGPSRREALPAAAAVTSIVQPRPAVQRSVGAAQQPSTGVVERILPVIAGPGPGARGGSGSQGTSLTTTPVTSASVTTPHTQTPAMTATPGTSEHSLPTLSRVEPPSGTGPTNVDMGSSAMGSSAAVSRAVEPSAVQPSEPVTPTVARSTAGAETPLVVRAVGGAAPLLERRDLVPSGPLPVPVQRVTFLGSAPLASAPTPLPTDEGARPSTSSAYPPVSPPTPGAVAGLRSALSSAVSRLRPSAPTAQRMTSPPVTPPPSPAVPSTRGVPLAPAAGSAGTPPAGPAHAEVASSTTSGQSRFEVPAVGLDEVPAAALVELADEFAPVAVGFGGAGERLPLQRSVLPAADPAGRSPGRPAVLPPASSPVTSVSASIAVPTSVNAMPSNPGPERVQDAVLTSAAPADPSLQRQTLVTVASPPQKSMSFASMFGSAVDPGAGPGSASSSSFDGSSSTTVQREAVEAAAATETTAPEAPAADTTSADSTTTEPVPAPVGTAQPVGAAAAAPVAGAPAGADLDEMARRLFEPLSARLRAELWLDRERAGMVVNDARR